MKHQCIIDSSDDYRDLLKWIGQYNNIMLVCGKSISNLRIDSLFKKKELANKIVRYSDFMPNPDYEAVISGVAKFRDEECDAVIAVGGGSAMDVAKCIKLYSKCNSDGKNGEFLSASDEELNKCKDVPFLAVPTTAGSGSEATRYAVIYYKGAKQSITSEDIIPDTVLLDPSVLSTLPDYQKKSTMMDALCHAIESFWSVNSTEDSRAYSKKAIEQIIQYKSGYLENTDEGNSGMLLAANNAGKAINITQTTAGHAMAYKITGLFGCAHGHSVAMCDRILFGWMVDGLEKGNLKCVDSRGEDYLKTVMSDIAASLGNDNSKSGSDAFEELFYELGFEIPKVDAKQISEMVKSVNPVRLKNHPVELTEKSIEELYKQIFVRKKIDERK